MDSTQYEVKMAQLRFLIEQDLQGLLTEIDRKSLAVLESEVKVYQDSKPPSLRLVKTVNTTEDWFEDLEF
jgi:hypothetical protein